jgi:hypothetical protein
VQAKQDGKGAKAALEEILDARGIRPTLGQAGQSASQDAEGIEKCADHAPIVASARKENNFLQPRHILSFGH